MRSRLVVTILLLAVVHVVLAAGVWWVGRPRAAATVVAVDTSSAAFERLAQLYASAAFRSVITFDYVALTDLIVRAAGWPEVLYVSVEDQSGQILAHSDRSNIGRSWDAAMAEALKARHGAAYREVTASIDGRPNGSSPSVGHVRLAYVSAPPAAAPAGRDGPPIGVLFGAAILLAVPVGVFVSWLRDRSEPARIRRIADLTREAERLADAEREIGRLRVELESHTTELDEKRAALAALEGRLESSHLHVDDEVRQRHARAVGYVVHAIRSSLTNVLGFSKLLLRGTLSDTQRADALSIHFAGRHLLTVVNDLVDLTQLENGTLKLKEELVEVRGLLDDAAAAAALPGRNATDVVIECPSSLRLVKADRSRLVQILETLVEQAPDSEGLVLRARGTEDVVELLVTWPRPASAKTLDELCEPFPPSNAGPSMQDGGRRLRLAVARGLALAAGGMLAMQHSGTTITFTLTIPAAVDALTVA